MRDRHDVDTKPRIKEANETLVRALIGTEDLLAHIFPPDSQTPGLVIAYCGYTCFAETLEDVLWYEEDDCPLCVEADVKNDSGEPNK